MKNLFINIYNGIFKYPDNKLKKITGAVELFSYGLFDSEKIKRLESIIDIKINNVGIYEQAFLHRSYLTVLNREDCISNERLEFFGDSVLGFIITEHLFMFHRDELEGKLTKIRSWLVNKHSLAVCAKVLKLDEFIMLSYSAEHALKIGSESIVADALEALIAAIYIDAGLDKAKEFVINKLLSIMLGEQLLEDKNYKSRLLETVQSEGMKAPSYSVLDESGPDHSKEFIIGVYVEDILKGTGIGKSKKEAEQNAAKDALDKYFSLTKT